jgi:hypothetical protein
LGLARIGKKRIEALVGKGALRRAGVRRPLQSLNC